MHIKVSIITVNYNSKNGLESTIQSVASQTYRNIEYIVIDGNSNDGSKKVLDTNKMAFNYMVSESDNGIYDAMNKGVMKATGDYVFFLNAGDTFYNDTTIEEFVETNPDTDLVYGNIMLINANGSKRLKKHLPCMSFKNCLIETVTHQAIFHKRTLFENENYDVSYRLISDWIFYFKQVIFNNATSKHIPLIISNYDTNGVSSKNVKLIEEERKEFLETTFSKQFYKLYLEFFKYYQRYNALKNHWLVSKLFKIKALTKER